MLERPTVLLTERIQDLIGECYHLVSLGLPAKVRRQLTQVRALARPVVTWYRSQMQLRRGVYIVPTHRWYIERSVWLVAGVVLLTFTALALLVHPLWVLGVIVTGIASITVSLTGFCLVGNLLRLFGFTPMLGDQARTRHNLYFMQTDRWYLERRIYLAVGINISLASVLSLVHSAWWLAFTAFVGGAMVWFAATGYCIMANGLYWLGAEPRLAPEAGKQPVTREQSSPGVPFSA